MDTTDAASEMNAPIGGASRSDQEADESNVEMSTHEEFMGEIERINEVVTDVELLLACASEKLVNLNILEMHVAIMESDFEAFASDKECLSLESAEKAMEFDLLSGILGSELAELNKFMVNLQADITDCQENVSSCKYLGDAIMEMEEKLQDSEKSLKQSQDQLSDIRMQSSKTPSCLENPWNRVEDSVKDSQPLSSNQGIEMQTVEQQRQYLRILEKSLARELDLDKILTESRHFEEELKLKILASEEEILFLEEELSDAWEKIFEVQNEAEVFLCISKELLEQQNILNAKFSQMETFILDLRGQLSEAGGRAKNAEAKCKLLAETNMKLSEELDLLKASDREKIGLIEKQLREADIRLQHAVASAEASQEKQNMLYSTIKDMDNLIEGLKSKVLKAENRAESAEDNCILLSETNAELNVEIKFLRGRLESLEASLHHTEESKMETAKDIGTRTKLITNLVMQLAAERERLHKQISSLASENKILVVTLQNVNKGASEVSSSGKERECKEPAGSHGSFSSTSAGDVKDEVAGSREPVSAASELENVRRIGAGLLSVKHIFLAMLLAVPLAVAYYIQLQS